MRKRIISLILLVSMVLICMSCQDQPGEEITEQPEPQRMAYHLGTVSRVEDSLYFTAFISTDGMRIRGTEYGTENFEAYVPCFDPVCDHRSRSKCCLCTTMIGLYNDDIIAFEYKGELAMVVFDPIDTCVSFPYSNTKINLLSEDFLNSDSPSKGYKEWDASPDKPKRKELFVYKDYLYYVEKRNGVRAQYRISLEGGEPERVFEEDNVIIRTIINDRYYGIKYDINAATPENDVLPTRDQIHYFRSDMNYENVEPLHQKLEFFSLLSDDATTGLIILEADEEYIYTLRGTKILAFSDSDMNAEPVLLSDTKGKIPDDLPSGSRKSWGYNNGTVYYVLNTGYQQRETLGREGFDKKTQWYESSTLYSFDIKTGECRELDISNQSYLIKDILYADDKYVYAKGVYIHDDRRTQEDVTIRLTLETMRYEAILPDDFWEYSAETTAE